MFLSHLEAYVSIIRNDTQALWLWIKHCFQCLSLIKVLYAMCVLVRLSGILWWWRSFLKLVLFFLTK